MDCIKRAMLFEGKAIVDVLETTDIVQKAIDYHHLSDDAAVALGKLLTLGAFISSGFKFKGNKLTLIMQGMGKGGKLVVCADTGAKVRGYMENPNAEGSVEEIVGKNGYLNIIKDFGLREPYNGLSEIVCGNIDLDFAYYFTKSEQLPSAISLGVKVKDGKCLMSSGVIVQPMPNCTDDIKFILSDAVSQLKDVAALVEERGSQGFLEYYFGHFQMQQLEDVHPVYECSCSDERIMGMLKTLGKKDVYDIIAKEGKIEVSCQFCSKKYSYKEEDISKIFDE